MEIWFYDSHIWFDATLLIYQGLGPALRRAGASLVAAEQPGVWGIDTCGQEVGIEPPTNSLYL